MKYKLTNNTKKVNDITLYQIEALKDFGSVNSGDLGGWIESEFNLSQEGDCWVTGNAYVYGNAQVYGSAQVYGRARVYGNAQVYGSARVSDNAYVYGNAQVSDSARVHDNARVYGSADVFGYAKISQSHWIKFSRVVSDLSLPENLIENIQSQTNLKVFNGEVYCYKHVREDLSSLYDEKFKYRINEWAEVSDVDLSNESCAPGLHVSHASYWEGNNGTKVLFCKVRLEDIITVQEGKIRCRKLFVIGVCDGTVY